MNYQKNWIILSLINLCIVALLGFLLRSKIMFSLPFIDYDHLINAHARFAFSAWVTLAFFTLFTRELLPSTNKNANRRWYQWMLWGVELTSLGMLVSFLIQGHGMLSIGFLTLFILCTYGYGVRFIADTARTHKGLHSVLSISALVCLMISSVGPFTLAYVLISGSTNSILYREAFYFYLHFMYNGFFTLSVFALLLNMLEKKHEGLAMGSVKWFVYLLCASIIPSFFLSLLWAHGGSILKLIAIIGVLLILGSLIFFFKTIWSPQWTKDNRWGFSRSILFLVFLSFILKSVLQMGTLFPVLGNAVFGLRPIIIGFLHLVFLGLASFYIFFHYMESGVFNLQNSFSRNAILLFVVAVVLQEFILMIQGGGLLMGTTHPIYNLLLWLISFLLLAGAVLICIAGIKSLKAAPIQ